MFVTAKTPEGEHHQTSDVDEILACLPADTDRRLPLEVLRKVPGVAAQGQGAPHGDDVQRRDRRHRGGRHDARTAYGMAFDIGTTSVVGTLMDLGTGEQLAAVGGLNPQAQYGGDLMSRIAYAQFDEAKLVTLRAQDPRRPSTTSSRRRARKAGVSRRSTSTRSSWSATPACTTSSSGST